MSKTVILMRHGHYIDGENAKAFGLGDKEALTPQGRADVDDVAEQMAEAGNTPDVIIYSPAPRTTETAMRMREVFKRVSGRDIPMIADRDLADGAGIYGLKAFENPVCAEAKTVLVISHEPNITVMGDYFGSRLFPQKGQAFLFEASSEEWPSLKAQKNLRHKVTFSPR